MSELYDLHSKKHEQIYKMICSEVYERLLSNHCRAFKSALMYFNKYSSVQSYYIDALDKQYRLTTYIKKKWNFKITYDSYNKRIFMGKPVEFTPSSNLSGIIIDILGHHPDYIMTVSAVITAPQYANDDIKHFYYITPAPMNPTFHFPIELLNSNNLPKTYNEFLETLRLLRL